MRPEGIAAFRVYLMFSRHNQMMGVLYALADGVLAVVSFGLAHSLRLSLVSLRPLYSVSYYFWIFPFVVALWLATGWATGLYRDVEEQDWRRALGGTLKVGVIATVVLFAFIFAFKVEFISRLLLIFYALIDFLLMALFRLAANRWWGIHPKLWRLPELLKRTSTAACGFPALPWWPQAAALNLPSISPGCAIATLFLPWINFRNCFVVA